MTKHFTQIIRGLNTDLLLAEIEADPTIWKEDTYLRDYPQGPFGHTESIILRFPPRSVHETEEALKNHLANFDQHENVWQPVAHRLPITVETVFDLMRQVKGTRLGRVMINKVMPGGLIYPHADTPDHANYWERFHVVIHSAEGNDFRCADEHVNMRTGEVWVFDNRLEHEVVNNSTEPRINMVVDIRCFGPYKDHE